MSKRLVAVISLVALPILILTWDVWLYNDGVPGNSISQSVIWLTDLSPLIPWLFGFAMGFLTCHWFESYFHRKGGEQDEEKR